MKVAVVGLGKMGREVEAVLRERGHEVVPVRRGEPFPTGCAVGIDFTRAESVVDNVRSALAAGARYVVGTTGWQDRMPEARALVEKAGGGLVYAANFSVGVNLFYRIVREAAALMARFPDYDPYVLEKHHRQKKDAPSGTARALAAILETASGRKAETQLSGALPDTAVHVAAVRAGGIVGEHTVGFDAGVDEILLEHRARSRRGFAAGSVLAAEWIATRTGFHTFEEALDELGRGGTGSL
jgi:4-hydroxy-tetrahydrodipicolinate reductase